MFGSSRIYDMSGSSRISNMLGSSTLNDVTVSSRINNILTAQHNEGFYKLYGVMVILEVSGSNAASCLCVKYQYISNISSPFLFQVCALVPCREVITPCGQLGTVETRGGGLVNGLGTSLCRSDSKFECAGKVYSP
jgi:hypothetical protein